MICSTQPMACAMALIVVGLAFHRNNCAIASPKTVSLSPVNCVRSACIAWLFSSYPETIRRSLSATNVVEAINVQLEMMPRNSVGYFHLEEILKLELGPAVSSREAGAMENHEQEYRARASPVQCHVSIPFRDYGMNLLNTTLLTSAGTSVLQILVLV